MVEGTGEFQVARGLQREVVLHVDQREVAGGQVEVQDRRSKPLELEPAGDFDVTGRRGAPFTRSPRAEVETFRQNRILGQPQVPVDAGVPDTEPGNLGAAL